MLQKRFAQGKTNGTWKTGMDVYNWWMGIEQPIDGQMKISDIDMNTQEE